MRDRGLQERRRTFGNAARADLHSAATDEQFRLLVDTVKDYAIFMLDPEGRVMTWNAGAEAIKGYSAEEIIGESFERFYTEEDRRAGKPKRGLQAAREHGRYSDQGERVRKDGSRFWADVVITALWNEGGTLRGFAKVTRDATEVRRAQQALEESERRLRFTLDAAEIGDWDLELATGEGTASPRHWHILGLERPPRPWNTERFLQCVHPEDREQVRRVIAEAIAGRRPVHYQCRIVRPDGETRCIEVHGAMRRAGDAGTEVMSGIVQDITVQKQNEADVRRLAEMLEARVRERTAQLADANLEMQAFNYTVSHDLRAPLRGIRGFAQVLLEDFGESLGQKGREYCQRISAAGERMERLIEDLLAYGRIGREELSVKPVELGAVVQDAVEELSALIAEARAEVAVARPLPTVMGHRPILEQAVQNLVGNALKFVAPGVAPKVVVRAERRGDWTRLCVDDNGIGVAPEHRERIFHVFERLHGEEQYPGTGIGLAIVRRALERLGGHAGMAPREGGGSTFWIELPSA